MADRAPINFFAEDIARTNPIITGFIHDVVEDITYNTIEDIEVRYGKDVAFLVGTVTKHKSG